MRIKEYVVRIAYLAQSYPPLISGAALFVHQLPGLWQVNGIFPKKRLSCSTMYQIAALFITASEIEIQSSILLEAAASGLPIVHDGINGYLVEPGDLTALATAMILLVRDPQKANLMGDASLRIAAPHTLDSAHEQLYRQ